MIEAWSHFLLSDLEMSVEYRFVVTSMQEIGGVQQHWWL
jgi:hypothetical protein